MSLNYLDRKQAAMATMRRNLGIRTNHTRRKSIARDGFDTGLSLAIDNAEAVRDLVKSGRRLCPSLDWIGLGVIDEDNAPDALGLLVNHAETAGREYSDHPSHGEHWTDPQWEAWEGGVAAGLTFYLETATWAED